MRACSIDGCREPFRARDLCASHYNRMRRWGDPLSGEMSTKEPREYLESVVRDHSGDDCLAWPYFRERNGYGRITINTKQIGAHRYVCILAHGAPPTDKHEAAHSCGKGHLACINPSHLSWKTPEENQADKLIHGTDCRGEKHPNAKLSVSQVQEIRELAKSNSRKVVADKFGISRSNVGAIAKRKLWGHVE